MPQPDAKPVLQPITSLSMPAGMMAPIHIQRDRDDLVALSAIAATLLDHPLQVRQLTERVYQLMQEDLRRQHERQGGYGRR